MISPKSAELVMETARIEDIVGDYVTLKKSGSSLKGLCPFHNEKTPSFIVSPAKNIFKCFGCSKGGSPVNFIMEHERLSFPEAIRYLATKYNIEVEELHTSDEQKKERQLYESLYLINQYAKSFYQDQLFNTDIGKSVGLNYFKNRGFREDTINKFGLGFAPNAKNAFVKVALEKGYEKEYLEMLGLMSKTSGGDFFRNRVLFAIHNLSGKVIGFGGRTLSNDKKSPKYINSPETEIYTKNKVLYGAFYAKTAIRKQDECILVEGYTDVISLHQAGIENVVASSGTSLTSGQINLIKRFTPNIKILYDGDAAGIKAALRGLDMVLEQNMNVKVVLLPEGEDPDGYLNKVGTTAFKEYIDKNANDFILFKTNLLLKESSNDPVKKSGLLKEIVRSIALIPDPLKRSVYIKECALLLDVQEQLLVNASNKSVSEHLNNRRKQKESEDRRNQAKRTAAQNAPFPSLEPGYAAKPPIHDFTNPFPQPAKGANSGDEFQEKGLARILINYGGEMFDEEEKLSVAGYILLNIEDVLDEFENPLYSKLVNHCLEMLVANKPFSKSYFIHHPDEEIRNMAVDLMSDPYEYSPNWKEMWEIELQTQPDVEQNYFRDAIYNVDCLKKKKIGKRIENNSKELKIAQEKKDEEQMMILMKVHIKLKELHQHYTQKTGTVVLKPKR